MARGNVPLGEPTMTAATLLGRSRRELARVMAAGRRFDPASIAGSAYRGTSLGLPSWVERLTWKKFAKVFHGDGGWNVRIEQDALDRPWLPQRRRGTPITFGRFAVTSGDGVVLDYGVGRGPLGTLRDPLVALDDRADLLLGRSLIAIGRHRIATPSYFTLERDPALTWLALNTRG